MLNILIADKDINNLKGIRAYIDSNFTQFNVSKICAEEKDFFKFLNSNTVDLIILEIRFFGINFFQKIKDLNQSSPNVKFIVYGTINDINYLEECLNLGAISYAIRPVKPAELKNCLNLALNYFKSFEELKKEEKMLNMEYLQNFKVFENRFLSLLINEAIFDKEEIENSFKYFNINISTPYTVAIVRIDNFRAHIISKSQKEKHTLIFKILKIIENNIQNAKAFINLFNEVVIIFGSENNLEEIIKILTEIKISIKESMNLDVSCGIGRCYENANNIHTSFDEATTSLRYRCIVGYNSVIPFDYVEPENRLSANYPYKREKDFVYTVVIGEYDYSLNLLNQIYNQIKPFKSNFEKIMPQVIFSIVLSINRLAFEQGLNIDNISNFFPTKDILNIKDLNEAYDFLKSGAKKFCEHTTKIRSEIKENLFKNAIDYISEKYFENITYKSLSNTLKCNTKFFKEIFDKMAKQTLPDYLAKFRIEKAKELILKTSLKDDIIALKLGFNDVKIFRQTFKRLEGCLVGDFRYINKDLKNR